MQGTALQALGRIEGKMDMVIEGQKSQDKKLEAMDARLRAVEKKAAITGAVGGGIAAVGTALAIELLKRAI